ncbi:hypothetical protein J4E91_001762 [Alternaria rosae]|nr:hypothetical protein J4E91_001762 [Alternaria rosae]
MSSLPFCSDSLNVCVDDRVWDMIFVDATIQTSHNKVVDTAPSTKAIASKDIDIRVWPFVDHKLLMSKYDRIKVFVGDSLISTISKPLFRATSTKTSELLVNGTVILPAETDRDGVSRLIGYLEFVISKPTEPLPYGLCLPMTISLDVCAAASALGMDRYVDKLWRECENLVRNCSPPYADIDAITSFRTYPHTTRFPRLFRILVNNLAVREWRNSILDPQVFRAYCERNPVLDAAIRRANEKYDILVRRRELYEYRDRKWEPIVTMDQEEDNGTIEWDRDYNGPVRERE